MSEFNNLKSRRTGLAALTALLFSVLTMSTCFAQTSHKAQASNPDEESIRKLFQARDDDKSTQYLAVFRDLNDDGIPEAIVYLMGPQRCGSGGCNLYILQQSAGSWKIVTSITITNPPIRVLDRKLNGWHSLGVWVQGGGIQPDTKQNYALTGKRIQRIHRFLPPCEQPKISPAKW